jgi:hypothetical protein
VVITKLAEASIAYYLGELTATAIFPIVGLILLIVGVRQQSRARRLPPGLRPPEPYPYSPPQNPSEPGSPAPQQEYYPSPPPAPRPSRWSIALIIVGSLLLAGSLLGIISGTKNPALQNRSAPTSPDVGQCIAAYNFKEHNKTPKAQDCADPDSIFEVVTKGDPSAKCPDGKTDESDYAFLRDGSTTLCFVLNFVQGRCYTATGDTSGRLFAPTDCAGSAPRFKVVTRVDGSSDTESCPAGTREIAYQNPARLYCLQPLEVNLH